MHLYITAHTTRARNASMTRAIAESDGRNELDTDGDGKGDGESSRRPKARIIG